MAEKNNVAHIIESLDATGRIGELVDAARGSVGADIAREALEELMASDPGAGSAVRETFLAWPAERREEAIDELAGSDDAARRTWARLLCGIVEEPDGTTRLG